MQLTDIKLSFVLYSASPHNTWFWTFMWSPIKWHLKPTFCENSEGIIDAFDKHDWGFRIPILYAPQRKKIW